MERNAFFLSFSLLYLCLQDYYGLSRQYNDFELVLYSNIDILLGNTLFNIAQRSLSKRCYLSFRTQKQKIFNYLKQFILF